MCGGMEARTDQKSTETRPQLVAVRHLAVGGALSAASMIASEAITGRAVGETMGDKTRRQPIPKVLVIFAGS